MRQTERLLKSLGASELSGVAAFLETEGVGVFTPTVTTSLLLKASRDLVGEMNYVLDLGCGWGVIGLELAYAAKIKLAMSDISESAVRLARKNAERLSQSADVRLGSGFEPWQGHRFDMIILDVSGVSSDVPAFSKWFGEVPAETGTSGHELTAPLVMESSTHLSAKGGVLVPLISLSNNELALDSYSRAFNVVREVGRMEWPLMGQSDADLLVMRDLAERGQIDFRLEGGIPICWTRVFFLSNPKG